VTSKDVGKFLLRNGFLVVLLCTFALFR